MTKDELLKIQAQLSHLDDILYEYHLQRLQSIRIIRALEIVHNVQLAITAECKRVTDADVN